MRILPILLFCIASLPVHGSVLSDANDLYANGRFGEAIGAYREAILQDANPAVAYFNIGNAYYQLDSIAAAIVCYEASVREAPDFYRAHLNLGILYYTMDDLGEAVGALERARALAPDDPQILLTLAASYVRLRHYRVAVPLLEQVLAADSSQLECYFMLFDINRELHDQLEARQWLERYPDQGARVADKYQLLGELVDKTEGPDKAVFYYRRLVDIAPSRRWAHYRLVDCLFRIGNGLSAVQQATASLDQFGDFAELALLAGNRALELQMYARAEAFYEKAYELGRAGGLVGMQNLLQVYEQRGDQTAAARLSRQMSR